MELMSLSGHVLGVYSPPGIPRLSSCLYLVMIKDACVDVVVWCFSCDVHSVCSCTLATMAMPSHFGWSIGVL